MKLLLFLITFIPATVIGEVNLNKHPIYAQIIQNKPQINKQYAMKLSNIIYKYSYKYKINTKIFTAILAQESMYKMVQGNCVTGYPKLDIEYLNAGVPMDLKFKLKDFASTSMTICQDYGIGQINYRNIEKLNLNKEKLLTDLDYSVEQAIKIFVYFKNRYKKSEPRTYWSRYNANHHEKREVYERLVRRYIR